MEAGAAAEVEAVVAVEADRRDRFGIGWREPLAAGIFTHLQDIDAIEVIAENCVAASRRRLHSLRALGREIPLLVHGVGLGAASVSTIDPRYLDRVARVMGVLEPCRWSEHLAFVRSGGYEIGHLAAPPRTPATVDGATCNVRRLGTVVGKSPMMENIATLMQPPGSTLEEPEWVSAIIAAAHTSLLLDLHNLYANAVNFGHEPLDYLRRLPLHAVDMVHISGGVWIGRKLLDDHLHDVPDPVYQMLEVVGEYCPPALTVILERDGLFPSMTRLLEQLRRARAAMATGRQRAVSKRREAHELDAA